MHIEEYGEISEEENTRCNFQDQVGTYLLGGAAMFSDLGKLDNIDSAKTSFYDALDKFMRSDYAPTEKINEGTLMKFLEYKSLDWKDKKSLAGVIEYFKSIAY